MVGLAQSWRVARVPAPVESSGAMPSAPPAAGPTRALWRRRVSIPPLTGASPFWGNGGRDSLVGQPGRGTLRVRPIVDRPTAALARDSGGSQPPRRLATWSHHPVHAAVPQKRPGSALKVGPGGGGNACYDVAEKQFLEEKSMGPLGWPEMEVIFFLALILFGPKKMPELGRTVGKALTEFRRASNELKSTIDREMKSLEQETESFKEISNQFQSDTYSYDYSSYESTYEGSYGNENN